MSTRKVLTVLTVAVLLFVMAVRMTGCVSPLTVDAADLMEGILPSADIETVPVTEEAAVKAADFGARLLKTANKEGKNILLSPLSVLAALSMTANGAKGDTLAGMEQALGMSIADLNGFFRSYVASLAQDDKNKLSIADSIWFSDDERLKVNREFLQTNADYYGADAYKVPFNDETLKAINDWVSKNTDGMIPQILDDIPKDAIMYLINALAFEAEWQNVYTEDKVNDGLFTLEDGSQKTVKMMYSDESRYLETGKATGFIKSYAGGNYAFVALLPNEGVPVSELIESLDGKTLAGAIKNASHEKVSAGIPVFENEYSGELSEILTEMGMGIAFDGGRADFSNLGETDANISISRVIHKTFISVAEKGTRAGAATAVEMTKNAALPAEKKTVILDRPFVYMLVDEKNCVPFFIGALCDTGN